MTVIAIGVISFVSGSVMGFLVASIIVASSDRNGCSCVNCPVRVDCELKEIETVAKEGV